MASQAYATVDLQEVALRTQDIMRERGANTVTQLNSSIGMTDRQGSYVHQSQQVRDIMAVQAKQDEAFQRNTDLLAQMNESWNANSYIAKGVQNETLRISRSEAASRKDIYMLRQRGLQARYAVYYNATNTATACVTMIITLLCLLVAAMFKAQRMGMFMMVVVLGILIVLYGLYMVSVARIVGSMRLDDEWGKFRWSMTPAMMLELRNASNNCTTGEDPVVPRDI